MVATARPAPDPRTPSALPRLDQREPTRFTNPYDADDSVDVLFLDAERTEYVGRWPHPLRVLRPGGVLAIDNVLAPSPDELNDFLALTGADNRLVGATVDVGKGLHLAWCHT